MASTADLGKHAAGKSEVSRAFGDAALKSKGLSAVADVQIFNLTKHDKFLLLGCDGFWSCWSADDAVATTQGLLEAGRTPKEAANRLVYLVGLIKYTCGKCLSANTLRILALPQCPASAVSDWAALSKMPLVQRGQPTDCQHSCICTPSPSLYQLSLQTIRERRCKDNCSVLIMTIESRTKQ